MTEMNETNPSTVLPGQERYVAPLDETPLKAVDSMDESAPASNMWADADNKKPSLAMREGFLQP